MPWLRIMLKLTCLELHSQIQKCLCCQTKYCRSRCAINKYIVKYVAIPLQSNDVVPLSYNTDGKETENSLGSHLYWFILYCLRFMNYCESDVVSHNAAMGFLNQVDRLIIEFWQTSQCSMEECTIPDCGGENITQHFSWVAASILLQVFMQLELVLISYINKVGIDHIVKTIYHELVLLIWQIYTNKWYKSYYIFH